MPKIVKKNDSGGRQEGQHKRPPVSCILHVSGIKHGEFIPFSQIKVPVADKLSYLQNIWDKRLSQPPWRLYANQFQTISHVLIWKQLVTIELATNISLKIRIGCSVTWSYLAHHPPLVNAHHPLAATYSLQKVFCQKLEKRYLGRPKGAPSF